MASPMTRNAMNITAMSGSSVATIPLVAATVAASAPRAGGSASLVLLISDLLQPVDGLTVELFLNGDVRHGRGRRRAVPVLLVRWEPDDVARPDFLDRAALALSKAEPGRHDERLPEWVRVPCRASARL